ncbi:MAG: exopolysaccharide biosynthesis polyprenyl glycosylphosphotransferase [Clostridium sp.]|nr:exopolysaccharide biosynthesis polyprenyl glycosylphosphotransferase [Clostridium sp.]MCM1399809.1 exopolysaccharide biosynthesis polyprenyl glycosylphosphotransferase [Clostridium sp.]MCM1459564.1 exopolysaccharide biosynthesis polyprenyl glycosylphosphotransferase [Bacteroides sp.]
MEQRKRFLGIVSNFLLWLFEIIAFSYVWFRCYDISDDSPFFRHGHMIVIAMYAIFIYMLTKSFHGYKISYLRASDLILAHGLSELLSNVAGYFFICMMWSEYMPFMPMVVLALVQIAISGLWVILAKGIYRKAFPPRRVIIIYGKYPLEQFLKKLCSRKDKYVVSELLNYEKGYEKICSEVLDFEGVFLYDLSAEERNSIIKYCYKHGIRTYVVPKITDIIMRGADDLHLLDTPLYLSRNQGLFADQRIVKRLVDIVVSIIGIVVLAPFMLIVAAIIKLYDGGPVFYRQERLTRDGKKFIIFKFRSMRTDAETTGACLARKHDDRVTPVGRVLRNFHIDELPQLFNVIAGDMSIVGPRPERPEIFEKYAKSIPEFDFRLKVKAGITGYAQVYGKYNTVPIDKLRMDLIYIQEYSLWLDIKLMLLTVRAIFRKESTEGVRDGQTTALAGDNGPKEGDKA